MFRRRLITDKGRPYPLGATPDKEGVNFSIYSKHATSIVLCLFNGFNKEVRRIALKHKTNDVWHIYIKGLKVGQKYGYRVAGPWDPQVGMRFNRHKLLLDPAAKLLTGDLKVHPSMFAYQFDNANQDLSFDTQDSAKFMPKCVVADTQALKNIPAMPSLKTPWQKTIIYEAHVKGYTMQNPAVSSSLRGHIGAFASKPVGRYLNNLGITALELLPIAANATPTFLQEKGLTNYWGYDPVCFMAPHASYLTKSDLKEIQQMVQSMHKQGIEVILDVVYNHTGEGNHLGPNLCLKGIDNLSYYRLVPDNQRYYMNDTGCGNMLNFDSPATLELVLHAMRYWVEVFHIDGFRFDLATTLGRTGDGSFSADAPFFKALKEDTVLKSVKLIAEPWDIGWGGYQYGNFPKLFGQWNDKFRDACRRFWKGDFGQVGALFTEFAGVKYEEQIAPSYDYHRINFLTAHDGFTGYDLVSYNEKHNEHNGEDGIDGNNTNWSWNSGIEGQSDKKQISQLRCLRLKAMLATLLLSNGTPMLLAGDEVLNTQYGNNNAYCQDSQISWINWKNISPYGQQMQQFVSDVLKMRAEFPLFSDRTVCVLQDASGMPLDAHNVSDGMRDFGMVCQSESGMYFLIFNANDTPVEYTLQKDKTYYCLLNTAGSAQVKNSRLQAEPWSVVVLKQEE